MGCEAPTWQTWSPFPCPGPQRTRRAPTFFPWVAPMARSGHQAWVGLGGQAGGPRAGAELRSWGPRGSLGQGPPASRVSCSWGTKAPHSCSRACSSSDGLRAIGLDRGLVSPGAHTPSWGLCGSSHQTPASQEGRKLRPPGLGRSKQSSHAAAGSSGQRVTSGRPGGQDLAFLQAGHRSPRRRRLRGAPGHGLGGLRGDVRLRPDSPLIIDGNHLWPGWPRQTLCGPSAPFRAAAGGAGWGGRRSSGKEISGGQIPGQGTSSQSPPWKSPPPHSPAPSFSLANTGARSRLEAHWPQLFLTAVWARAQD